MKKLLILAMIFSITLGYSQRVDTLKKETLINLHLDKYDFSFGYYKEPFWFVRPTTPYLYLENRLSFPTGIEPSIYPTNFNPLGRKVLLVGGIKIYLFR